MEKSGLWIVDIMTVWMLENSRVCVCGVVGRSGTKADTMLEIWPVLLAASIALMAKYLAEGQREGVK